jgi:hypothetical protein
MLVKRVQSVINKLIFKLSMAKLDETLKNLYQYGDEPSANQYALITSFKILPKIHEGSSNKFLYNCFGKSSDQKIIGLIFLLRRLF